MFIMICFSLIAIGLCLVSGALLFVECLLSVLSSGGEGANYEKMLFWCIVHGVGIFGNLYLAFKIVCLNMRCLIEKLKESKNNQNVKSIEKAFLSKTPKFDC